MTTLWDQPCCSAPRCGYWASPGTSEWSAGCSGATLRWERRPHHSGREMRPGRELWQWETPRSPGPRRQSSGRLWRDSYQPSCKTILQSGEENVWMRSLPHDLKDISGLSHSQLTLHWLTTWVPTEARAGDVHVENDVAQLGGDVGVPVQPPLSCDCLTPRMAVSKYYISLVRKGIICHLIFLYNSRDGR